MSSESAIKVVIDGSRFGVEGSLKKFKRLCEAAGVLKEYRKRKEFKKPSVRKKEKVEAANKRKAKDKAKAKRNTKI
ncbi:MAG: 30S ribosomal protein S21 [Halobacteriovoraceae bacterium]|nr:30S ribosomal protein S21 [Halobacteriovoraceae bacterium]|tara:strand:+ start:408 stop:635 length:228 start_codon:yes stop_codon:yes gene_type:complete